MDDDIKRLTQETCLALIPQFYDGVLEATRIQQVNDAIIEPFIAGIMRIHRNAYIQTMDADALSELENGLGIVPSGTIEQRRQNVIDTLCDQHILNDAKLHELCQSYLPGFIVYERTDPRALTLGVYTTEDGEDGDLPAVEIVDEIRPIVPQNLALYAGVETSFDRGLVASYAHRTALRASLGLVEYIMSPNPGLCLLDLSGELLLEAETKIKHYTPSVVVIPDGIRTWRRTVRIVGGEIAHWSKVYTFINIPQPTLGFIRIIWTFQNVPQPAVGTISRQDAFEGIPQPTLGFFDGG